MKLPIGFKVTSDPSDPKKLDVQFMFHPDLQREIDAIMERYVNQLNTMDTHIALAREMNEVLFKYVKERF